MKKLNQKGFSLVEGILIFVIVALIGGVGYYVWNAQKKTNESLDSASQNIESDAEAKKESEKKPEVDPTADWTAYSNTEGKFSFKHPKTWVFAANLENCPGTALVAVNQASVGRCPSSSGGQMVFVGREGSNNTDNELTASYYTNIKTEKVTLNGVEGTKTSATAKDMSSDVMVGGIKEGTQIVRYRFVSNGWTYTATYFSANSSTDFPDALSDFNTLVTKTLKFTP